MTRRFTLLLIDENLPQTLPLRNFLEQAGYRVRTADNGMKAIVSIYQSPPDLILSDIPISELNGYHLCRILKNDPLTQNIPIVLFSSQAEPHNRFWGEKAGADAFLEKTADYPSILTTIEKFLNGREDTADPPPRGARGLNGKAIRNQITGLLDRLLYESTICNEVLKLTGLAHDSEALARELFNFLGLICRYSAAGLLLREGADKYSLFLQLMEPVSDGFIKQSRKEMLHRAGLDRDVPGKYRFILIEQEAREGRPMPVNFQVLSFLPIYDGNELLASLTLFENGQRRLTKGMSHALDVIADRFLIVARYLKKIKDMENVKADLVSMLVHDMRSPLTGISGFTNVLAEGILGQVSPDQGAALKNIQEGCTRLLALIDDILDYSKLEAGKMQVAPRPLELAPLIAQVLGGFSVQLEEHRLRIEQDLPETLSLVMADEKQLTRVLANLLSNAVKFTPDGGSIRIAAVPATTRQKQAALEISISDTGCGIPVQQQKNLFGRYEQLPSATVYRKGTGLGLAICKEIVSLHNGEIWVESPVTDGRGSRFAFTIPLATP